MGTANLIRKYALITIVSSGFAAIPAKLALAECPQNWVACSKIGPIYSTAPRLQVDCRGYHGLPTGYDIPQGKLTADVYTDGVAFASAFLDDDFQLEGPPVGTTWNIRANLQTRFRWNRGLTIATLRSGSRDVSVQNHGESGSADELIQLDLEIHPGESFRLSAEIYADGYEGGWSTAEAQLGFSNLPPGSRITSCNGYVQDFPVATQSRSWGAIKAAYR